MKILFVHVEPIGAMLSCHFVFVFVHDVQLGHVVIIKACGLAKRRIGRFSPSMSAFFLSCCSPLIIQTSGKKYI